MQGTRTRQDTADQLQEVLWEVLVLDEHERTPTPEDTMLADTGLDSTDYLDLGVRIETKLGFDLPYKLIEWLTVNEITTWGKLITHVHQLRSAGLARRVPQKDNLAG